MTNAKHTRGPWKLEPQINGDISIHSTTCGCLAIIPTQIHQYQKNAQLIAAAPDLLEALKACVSQLDDACFVDAVEAYEKGKAAIKKAEGGV